MKGFPNQIADLLKHSSALRVIDNLVKEGRNASDDAVLGEALVRAGIIRGRGNLAVEEYLEEQWSKSPANRSIETTARGLRELYFRLGLVQEGGPGTVLTNEGTLAASYTTLSGEAVNFWRTILRSFTHIDADGESHPYQVLLRLIARKPGISRAKCALALEAHDDSSVELDRIVGLADFEENEIIEVLRVSQSNWDNAKKILPSFAEQLGDVVKSGQTFTLSTAPGSAEAAVPTASTATRKRSGSGRIVSAETIGLAGLAERHEPQVSPKLNPEAARKAIAIRADRLKRHNILVREVAALLEHQMKMQEDPYDLLGSDTEIGILMEFKTLDGSADDEVAQVRDSLSQLLYYEAFAISELDGRVAVKKIACFEAPISNPHRIWLNSKGIGVIWKDSGRFCGDSLAKDALNHFMKELA